MEQSMTISDGKVYINGKLAYENPGGGGGEWVNTRLKHVNNKLYINNEEVYDGRRASPQMQDQPIQAFSSPMQLFLGCLVFVVLYTIFQ